MSEVWFYHLERRPLAAVLPDLLARGLERQWRMAIETVSPARVDELSNLLWTHEDVSFLPHGKAGEPQAGQQPIWLTDGQDNPNAAAYRFYVDGAMPGDVSGLSRAVIMLDAGDTDAIDQARNAWRQLKAEGHAISYWQQNENGRWENRAAAGGNS